MKRPVVATTDGIRGLPAVPDENVLVGTTPIELIEQCASALASANLRERLAAAGHRTVTMKHDIGTISRNFASLCLSIIGETDQS